MSQALEAFLLSKNGKMCAFVRNMNQPIQLQGSLKLRLQTDCGLYLIQIQIDSYLIRENCKRLQPASIPTTGDRLPAPVSTGGHGPTFAFPSCRHSVDFVAMKREALTKVLEVVSLLVFILMKLFCVCVRFGEIVL